MTDRKAIQRILERLGFVHVAGWVRKEDAPRIRARIKDAEADVEAAKRAMEREHQFHENHGKIRPDTSETSHA